MILQLGSRRSCSMKVISNRKSLSQNCHEYLRNIVAKTIGCGNFTFIFPVSLQKELFKKTTKTFLCWDDSFTSMVNTVLVSNRYQSTSGNSWKHKDRERQNKDRELQDCYSSTSWTQIWQTTEKFLKIGFSSQRKQLPCECSSRCHCFTNWTEAGNSHKLTGFWHFNAVNCSRNPKH